MNRSETITKLAAALVAVQSKLEGAVKDSDNSHLKSKYADLASCWDACRDLLAANGLAVIQMPVESEANQVRLLSSLVHVSGEFIESVWSIPVVKNDPQGYGSALTYIRRYALCAMVGICPVDDDAEAAAGKPTQAAQRRETPKKSDSVLKSIQSLKTVAAVNDFYRALSPADRQAYMDDLAARKQEIAKTEREAANGTAQS